MRIDTLRFRLTAHFRRDAETQAYVLYCPTLDICTAAPTRAECKPTMRSAANLFIRTCYERGILDQVLRRSGFKKSSNPPVNPFLEDGDFIAITERPEEFDSFPFEVPIELVAAQHQLGAGADVRA